MPATSICAKPFSLPVVKVSPVVVLRLSVPWPAVRVTVKGPKLASTTPARLTLSGSEMLTPLMAMVLPATTLRVAGKLMLGASVTANTSIAKL